MGGFRFSIVLILCGLCGGSILLHGCGERATTAGPATAPAAGYRISIDVSEVPEMMPWADQLQGVVDAWYPKIVAMLPGEGFTPAREVRVIFKRDIGDRARSAHAVAYTAGAMIVGDAEWFRKHPDDQGAIVHELVHVVQNYHDRKTPGWVVEGVADYVRWFNYEPVNKRPRPDPKRATYADSYQTAGAFLDYLVRTHDPKVVENINAYLRKGDYSEDLWKTYAGGTLDALWSEYVASLQR